MPKKEVESKPIKPVLERSKTGIDELDAVLDGGFPKGSVIKS